MRRALQRLLALLALLVAGHSHAHELQPGFLELKESVPGTYEVLWKLPSLGEAADVRMPIVPVFPERCRQAGQARSARAGTAWVYTAQVECAGGLAGQAIAFEGLSAFATDVLVRVQHADGFVETHVVKPVQPALTLRAGAQAQRGIGAYLYLGVEHILLGVDHLLFVLGLLLIVRARWALVKTITAFTVAHSLTLAAVTLGWLGVPDRPVNAVIALSIVFVAAEILRARAGG